MQRIVLPVALAVSLSTLSSSPALAQWHRHGGKGVSGTGPGSVFRVTTFRYASLRRANVTGKVSLLRMPPNTTYSIAVFESPAPTVAFTRIVAGTLTTDNAGSGNLAIKVQCIPGSTTFSFAAVPQGVGQTYGGPAVELD